MAGVEASAARLLRLIYGYQVSQAIHVAAVLGIADELADGPRAVGDLASATATHAGTPAPAAARAGRRRGPGRKSPRRRRASTPR